MVHHDNSLHYVEQVTARNDVWFYELSHALIWLHNHPLTIGFSPITEDIAKKCGSVGSVTYKGQEKTVVCQSDEKGRYVSVQRSGHETCFSEIRIKGRNGKAYLFVGRFEVLIYRSQVFSNNHTHTNT